MGQRVLKTASNGVITVHHYGDGNLIAESNAKGQVTRASTPCDTSCCGGCYRSRDALLHSP
jgi:hypothetical protein